jgi:coproporphyrinogen III oxidase
MNVRMLAAHKPAMAERGGRGSAAAWTSLRSYGFAEDAVPTFHQVCNRDALAPFGADKYPRFKTLV